MNGEGGRIAVVTGAARGIGLAVCSRLARDGWAIVGVDLDPAVEAIVDEIPRARARALDVTDEDQWGSLLATLESEPGHIAALVNCAGILCSEGPVVGVDVQEWRRVLDVNLTGTFVSCKAVLPAMLRGHLGRIVNLASIAGKEGNALQAAYSASKGGVIAFTKALAKEVARDGITVNAIAPTMIEGSLSESMSTEMRQQLLAKIPMGRFGQPEEVASLVAWICSDECSFTTGVVFDLTGGRATY
ncbi:MAG: SDR family NAD(P)-dependent oxidoreductase [Acidimicrobiales bacterium]